MEKIADMMDRIADLFAYEEMGIRRFSKKTYAPSFEKFQEIAAEFDAELNRRYETFSEENKEEGDVGLFCDEIAEMFVEYIKKDEDEKLSRGKQEEKQQNHNLFMVSYVLPHILEMRNPYYKELAQSIEKAWGASFKNSKIKAGTYETVAGGFQRKFLGFSL
ncbi:MAG: hypothetical protein HDR00_14900 [Lachnospiraceae bacterium]|nr:hypothetical protein [Lachnospiraceae bacterium]